MAILQYDDFRGYAVADITRVWDQQVLAGTISLTGGRNNGAYWTTGTTGNTYALKTPAFTAAQSTTVGFGFYNVVPGGIATENIIQWQDAATVQSALSLNADRTLSITRGTGTAVTDGTSVSSLADNTWYWIEVTMQIADSIGAGSVIVKVNGVTWITVATGQDLKTTANATCNQIAFGKFIGNGSAIQFRFADVFMTNGTTFLGDSTVSTLAVTGDGTTQNFASTETPHWNSVDEASSDDDTTYVSDSVANEIELFTMANLAVSPLTIHAVSPWNLLRKTDAGAKTAAAVVRSGTTNYVQANYAVTDTYKYDRPILETDPDTAVAWTESGVNAIEAGVKVIA